MPARAARRARPSCGCGARCQLALTVVVGGGASIGLAWQALHGANANWDPSGLLERRPARPEPLAPPRGQPQPTLGPGGAGVGGAPGDRAPPRTDGGGPPEGYKIYTFWNYPKGPGPLVKLNLETWRRHTPPGTQIVFVNDSNYRELVPDAPDEFFRLPDSASRSDAIRASVLFHQGGLYMDTDFVAMGSLLPVFRLLEEGWDVVTYTDAGGQKGLPSGACMTGDLLNKSFSSNFMAARRGNSFSKTWWENIKAKLTRMCAEGEWVNWKTCCHWAFSPERDSKKCNLPWAYLEHLKIPQCDDDALPRPAKFCPFWRPPLKDLPGLRKGGPEVAEVHRQVKAGNRPAAAFEQWSRVYCLAGDESLTPHLNGEIYFQRWNSASVPQATKNITAPAYDKRFECVEQGDGDVYCPYGNWAKQRMPRNHRRFFHRMAHHLFLSNPNRKNSIDVKTVDDVWNTEWLLTEMYRRSLGRSSG